MATGHGAHPELDKGKTPLGQAPNPLIDVLRSLGVQSATTNPVQTTYLATEPQAAMAANHPVQAPNTYDMGAGTSRPLPHTSSVASPPLNRSTKAAQKKRRRFKEVLVGPIIFFPATGQQTATLLPTMQQTANSTFNLPTRGRGPRLTYFSQ